MSEARPRVRFSIRSLLGLVTLAAILVAFFSFERTAELRLPQNGSDPDLLVQSFRSDATIRALVKSIPEPERPRLLRGENPDYQWLKQNISTAIDPTTREVTVSIATRRATSAQLRRILDSFSSVRVVVSFAEAPPRSVQWSRFFGDTFSNVQSRIATALPDLEDLPDQTNSEALILPRPTTSNASGERN